MDNTTFDQTYAKNGPVWDCSQDDSLSIKYQKSNLCPSVGAHNKTLILEKIHGYLHVLHVGKTIWEDGIITEKPKLPCKCNITYMTDETSGEIHQAL